MGVPPINADLGSSFGPTSMGDTTTAPVTGGQLNLAANYTPLAIAAAVVALVVLLKKKRG